MFGLVVLNGWWDSIIHTKHYYEAQWFYLPDKFKFTWLLVSQLKQLNLLDF